MLISKQTSGAGAERRLRSRSGGRTLAVTVGVVVSALCFGTAARAATIKVSNTQQLEAAVASSQSGDTIDLAAGTYDPDSTLDLKVNLIFSGPTTAAPAGSMPGAYISGANIANSDPAETPDLFRVERGASVTFDSVSLGLVDRSGSAVDDFGTLELANSDVTQNASVAAIEVEGGASLKVVDSTIGDNLGAGVDSFGTASFLNATIVENTESGIFDESGSTTDLTNTLVADNGTGTAPTTDCNAPVTSSTNSMDGDGSCGANLHGNPNIGDLAFNGASTLTAALKPGSPAIGAGMTSACPSVDQRFLAWGGTCDIGAFAFNASTPGSTPPPKGGVGQPAGPGIGSSGASGGGSPSSGGKATNPSGSRGSGSGPASSGKLGVGARAGHKAATVVAQGAIRGPHGRIDFTLRGTLGVRTALVVFSSPGTGVRFRATRLSALSFDRRLTSATLRGTALNLVNRRNLVYTIVVSRGRPPSFRIDIAGSSPLRGVFVSGRVSIAP